MDQGHLMEGSLICHAVGENFQKSEACRLGTTGPVPLFPGLRSPPRLGLSCPRSEAQTAPLLFPTLHLPLVFPDSSVLAHGADMIQNLPGKEKTPQVITTSQIALFSPTKKRDPPCGSWRLAGQTSRVPGLFWPWTSEEEDEALGRSASWP